LRASGNSYACIHNSRCNGNSFSNPNKHDYNYANRNADRVHYSPADYPHLPPTFDVSTIVTAASAPQAECPEENPEIVADFSGPYIYSSDEILTYLNSGGSLTQLAIALSARDPDSSWGKIIDLSGDGLSEVVYRGLGGYNILGCKGGKYQSLFEFARDDFRIDLEEILDLNKNGIPELIFYSFIRHGFAEVYIIGWDGNDFSSLIDVGVDTTTGVVIDSVSTATDYKIIDTNGDVLKEIVVVDNVQEALPDFSYYWRPLRNQTITLGWNGQNYVDLKPGNYTPPQYRFQAIQDADWQMRYGNYVAALSLYQEAIFNEQLEWWSPERKDYENYAYISQFEGKPITSPTPIPDATEYPRLAAYAYYRIMLLHIVQGHESDAGTVYKTLQQKFGNKSYSQPYVEMATAFWEAHWSTRGIYDGCAAAIQYTVEHPEILTPLGGGWYYGSQSHAYVPTDVCPFR
jgi:hypothetical protein